MATYYREDRESGTVDQVSSVSVVKEIQQAYPDKTKARIMAALMDGYRIAADKAYFWRETDETDSD